MFLLKKLICIDEVLIWRDAFEFPTESFVMQYSVVAAGWLKQQAFEINISVDITMAMIMCST